MLHARLLAAVTLLAAVFTAWLPQAAAQPPAPLPPASTPPGQLGAPGQLHQPGPVTPPGGGTPGQLGQPAAAPVGPPFRLSEAEQQFVDQILLDWEANSDKIKTFTAQFERLEFDPVFGPGGNTPMIKSRGRLSYEKPDKGSFKIDEVRRWKKEPDQEQGGFEVQKHEIGEHWVCDGKAVFEYDHKNKQLVVQPLPPEMQGQSIVDGPLPFLFGAKAEKLKRRYWIRSPQGEDDSIFLEAYPRTQADAANYSRVDIQLDRKTMMPRALQVWMPNGRSRSLYVFEKPSVNNTIGQLFGSLFKSPRTPLGWKRVVQDLPPTAPQASAPEDTATR